MTSQSIGVTAERERVRPVTSETDETPGQEVSRRRRVLRGPKGREMTQQQLAKEAGVSVETIGNLEKNASARATTLPLVRATLTRLEAEQGVGVSHAPALPPMVAAALAIGTPDVIRTRLRGGIPEVVVLVRPAGMSEDEFYRRVADFDADR
jgi:transcriptional regulator with XRE-family HTH domain